MALIKKHNEIDKRKAQALPINYSFFVDKNGELQTRKASKQSADKEDYLSLLNKRIVTGYAVIWGSVNDYKERFVKGCFGKSIDEHGPSSTAAYRIKFRDQHGKSCSLFASLEEDEIGLYFRTVPLDEVQWCDDLLVQLRSGTINNFSIGWKPIWERCEWDDELNCLVVLECRLFEISAVSIPSDLESFMCRSSDKEVGSTLDSETEELIASLDKSKQVELRQILYRHIALAKGTPQIIAPAKSTPQKTSPINYDYLIKNLKL